MSSNIQLLYPCLWQIVRELPGEHGLLLDNLLDIVQAPFVHTSTFAKGWSVPSLLLQLYC